MAPHQPPTSDRFARADARRTGARRADGKEALFSTAPTAPQPAQVQVTCQRCGTLTGVGVQQLPALLTPPALWNPISGFLWGKCPACGHRARLDVRTSQALRALADMVRTALGGRRHG